MIREVDLVSYLPTFLAEFKETAVTLEAENPEFRLVWEKTDKVLKNEFIATADEYGISRYEKMLGIFPSGDDTIESRRSRVQTRWFNLVPYTLKALISKLIALCGGNDFTITKDFDFYRLVIEIHLELYGQVDELERLVDGMLPVNMTADLKNEIVCKVNGYAVTGIGITYTDFITIS